MRTQKLLKDQLESLKTLQSLTDAYAEIASRRMKDTRDSVVKTRDFLVGLEEIFNHVRWNYQTELQRLSEKEKKETGKLTFLAHNGKTVSVFLSANAGLYGDIIPKVFKNFEDEVRKGDTEVTIVGRLGRELFLQRFGREKPYTFFEYPDVGTNETEFNSIAKHLVPYEEIRIHYGQFKNVARQEPVVYNISAETSQAVGNTQEAEVTKYIFEPTLNKILIFFETEMFSSLLSQTMRESQLAKFASRMLAMDKAYTNIQDRFKIARIEHLKMIHDTADKKQRTLFSSMNLWRK